MVDILEVKQWMWMNGKVLYLWGCAELFSKSVHNLAAVQLFPFPLQLILPFVGFRLALLQNEEKIVSKNNEIIYVDCRGEVVVGRDAVIYPMCKYVWQYDRWYLFVVGQFLETGTIWWYDIWYSWWYDILSYHMTDMIGVEWSRKEDKRQEMIDERRWLCTTQRE